MGAGPGAQMRGSWSWPGGGFPLWKTWLGGIVLLIVDLLVATLLMQAGYLVISIIWACLCGIALGLLAMFVGATLGAQVFGLAAGVVLGFGLTMAGQDQIRLFGATARDIAVADAPGSPAAFFHFRDARILGDEAGATDVYGSSRGSGSHILYTLYAAPLVGADWTPDRPVAVFAVIASQRFGHRTSEWARPWNAGVRLSALDIADAEKAVRDVARHSDLNVVANPLFVRWSADPEGEAAAARWALANMLLIVLIGWSLVLAACRLWPKSQDRASTRA